MNAHDYWITFNHIEAAGISITDTVGKGSGGWTSYNLEKTRKVIYGGGPAWFQALGYEMKIDDNVTVWTKCAGRVSDLPTVLQFVSNWLLGIDD
jgi:hypothetical protein